jgi:hypothetical protein
LSGFRDPPNVRPLFQFRINIAQRRVEAFSKWLSTRKNV